MFNQEQKDYMKSAKNKIDSWCEKYHNESLNYGEGEIRHRIGCSKKVK